MSYCTCGHRDYNHDVGNALGIHPGCAYNCGCKKFIKDETKISWKDFILEESNKDYYKSIQNFIEEDSKTFDICPKRKHLFEAYRLCELENIKVVILGQDPYHGDNQAHGLSFSVPPGIPIPPSLRNIYKEIKNDLKSDTAFSYGCLLRWADQGVFLLNSILTVRKGEPSSHKSIGWETFTDNTIKLINDLDRPIVFMLWGAFAKSKKNLITNTRHLILEAAHPSPFSAHNGFFGCKHFSKANEFLSKQDIIAIDWDIK